MPRVGSRHLVTTFGLRHHNILASVDLVLGQCLAYTPQYRFDQHPVTAGLGGTRLVRHAMIDREGLMLLAMSFPSTRRMLKLEWLSLLHISAHAAGWESNLGVNDLKDSDTPNGLSVPHDLIENVVSTFFLYSPPHGCEALNELAEEGLPWGSLINDAIFGLNSTLSAASLPFQMAFASVQQRRFDRILSAERIRKLKDSPIRGELNQDLEKEAYSTADEKMATFIDSPAGHLFLQDSVIIELNSSLKSVAIREAARQLLHQSLVSLWTVFENFASKFIVDWLNANPKFARPVIYSPDLKSLFGKQSIDFSLIEDNSYDLTGKMGTVLFQGKRLDNLSIIKSVLKSMFNDKSVNESLGQTFWIFSQRRHVIVHNQGIIDRLYISNTGEDSEIGKPIELTSRDLDSYIDIVERAIIAISRAASSATLVQRDGDPISVE